jgi:hypothetical protein
VREPASSSDAQHIRNIPERNSDVNDAIWFADLLAQRDYRRSL